LRPAISPLLQIVQIAIIRLVKYNRECSIPILCQNLKS